METMKAMKHPKLKKYAKWMQERNPRMKYTTAKRLNAYAPVFENPEGNIIIAGSPGSGCTIAAQWIAAQLHHEGYALTYIDPYKEMPTDFMRTVTDRIYGYGYTNRDMENIEGVYTYLKWLQSAQRGSKDQPAAIVLDNFEYIIEVVREHKNSQISQDFMDLYRELLEDEYTSVIMRTPLIMSSARESALDFIEYSDLYSNVLLMSNVRYDDRLLRIPVFKKYYLPYDDKRLSESKLPLGTGLLWKRGKDPMYVHIPFDDSIHGSINHSS